MDDYLLGANMNSVERRKKGWGVELGEWGFREGSGVRWQVMFVWVGAFRYVCTCVCVRVCVSHMGICVACVLVDVYTTVCFLLAFSAQKWTSGLKM